MIAKLSTRRLFSRCLGAIALLLVGACTSAVDDEPGLYFPPADGAWEQVLPEAAGWDGELLQAALAVAAARNSSGVVVLHRGRLVAESYWEVPADVPPYANYLQSADATGRAIEDVASAQKSIVAVLVGMAAERGLLNIDSAVSDYLGAGWSQAPEVRERAITLRHLLTMTSGLDEALRPVAAPGDTWFYNTPAYHFLMRSVEAVTGRDRNQITRDWLTGPLGMNDSSWTARPWTDAAIGSGFSTSARDLARFGLMIQAGGRWGDRTIITDTVYLADMLSPSQSLNPAYGYLWWLNGQGFSRAPGALARRVEGPLIEAAPDDLVALQGALDRKLYLVPSLGLVITRLGGAGQAGGVSFNEAFWEALMAARR